METIKEEKKLPLEQLLNRLLEKGWKPFNTEEEKIYIAYRPEEKMLLISNDGIHGYPISLRDLTSMECGLWQFVCENGMVKEGNVKNFIWTRYEHTGFEPQYPLVHKWNSAEYRLIESSLKDESELEDFLLQNIKVDD